LNQPNIGAIKAWAAAVRPPSLLIAFAPVMVGTALGFHQTGSVNGSLATLALLAAVLMQVITNLQNDVGYTERGGELVGHRIGLPRATALGWLTAQQVRRVIALLSVAAAALGLVMVLLRGWPVLALGAASLVAALAYMGGPKPIAYTPWGEATVLVFFGPVAVLGTGWLLSGGVGASGVFASLAVGSIAAAALAVNNHRDMEHDFLAGRKTFAVTYGRMQSKRLLAVLLSMPFIAIGAMAYAESAVWPLVPVALVPVAIKLYQDFLHCPGGEAFNAIVFRTFRIGLWFAGLLSVSALVA
jgi:1,4-dihydroxy-2-naphthoate octaprenyltransferase